MAKESVEDGVKRIVAEQVEKAIGEIDREELSRHETVPQVRKRCKKIRGVLRLVRPQFPAYRDENVWFRDAAREVSFVRDAEGIVEIFDEIAQTFADQVALDAFEPIRAALAERRKRIVDEKVAIEEKLQEFRRRPDSGKSWRKHLVNPIADVRQPKPKTIPVEFRCLPGQTFHSPSPAHSLSRHLPLKVLWLE